MKTPEQLAALDAELLQDYRARVIEQIEALDEQEPADQMCEAYTPWAETHEALEDLLDDIDDLLDERS